MPKLNLPRETIIAMVADYLLGKSIKDILLKYDLPTDNIIYYWIRRHKEHFKLRTKRRVYGRKGG